MSKKIHGFCESFFLPILYGRKGGGRMNLTAQRLRALRKRKGLSQTEVARILGITRTAYNKYESGASAPSRKLRELAQLYHVSTDYILGEEDALAEKLREADARTSSHLRKYLDLSDEGKDIVDITLDAVYARERNDVSSTESSRPRVKNTAAAPKSPTAAGDAPTDRH